MMVLNAVTKRILAMGTVFVDHIGASSAEDIVNACVVLRVIVIGWTPRSCFSNASWSANYAALLHSVARILSIESFEQSISKPLLEFGLYIWIWCG